MESGFKQWRSDKYHPVFLTLPEKQRIIARPLYDTHGTPDEAPRQAVWMMKSNMA
jgi:hypothetical protein